MFGPASRHSFQYGVRPLLTDINRKRSDPILNPARKHLAILEKGMSPEARLRGQQRTKELQKEIQANIAAKKAGK